MKIVNIILIVLFSLFGLVFVGAVFLPKSYEVERSVELEVSAEAAFTLLTDYSKRAEWDSRFEATKADASVEMRTDGTPGALGHSLVWRGTNVGEGKLILTDVTSPSYVRAVLRYLAPNPMDAVMEWHIEALGADRCKVRWVTGGPLDYPAGRIMGLFFDGMLGKDMELRLSGLRSFVESVKS